MTDQIWSWVLGFIGIAGFIAAGKKIWWAWYINIAAQFIWFAYAIVTQQWGFLLSSFVYMGVFVKNAYDWTRERNLANDSLAKAEAALKRAEETLDRVEQGVISQDEARQRVQQMYERNIKVPEEFKKIEGDVT